MIVKYAEIKIDSQKEMILYLQRKFKNCKSCMQLAVITAAEGIEKNVFPPMEKIENFPPLNAAQDKLINKRKLCALDSIRDYHPLDDNEKIDDDYFSFLSSDWRNIKRGTPVLRRSTNLSTVYFFFESDMIDFRDINIIKAQMESSIPPDDYNTDLGEYIHELGNPIASIALSVAGAIAGKFATMAIEKIMGTSIPDYFKEVYAQMRIIISEELDQHMIQEITDEFVGAQNWNHNHYIPLKNCKNPPPSQNELENEMNKKQQEFYSYLAKLMDDNIASVCLAEFLIGANIHLAFIQELLVVTNKKNYSEEFCNNVTLYSNHVTKTWGNIVSIRRNKIKVVNDKDCKVIDINVTKCWGYYSSYDQLNQTEGKHFIYNKDSKEKKAMAEEDAENRRNNEVNQLRIKVGQPEEVIEKWKIAANSVKEIMTIN